MVFSMLAVSLPNVVIAGIVVRLCAPSVLFFLRLFDEALRAKIVPQGGVAIFGPLGAKGPELLARIAATPTGRLPTSRILYYPNYHSWLRARGYRNMISF